jgi:flagellar biosynthesis protein FlhF
VDVLQSELNDGKVVTGAAWMRPARPASPSPRNDWHPELSRMEISLVKNGVDDSIAHQLLEGVNREIMEKGYPRSGSLSQLVKSHMAGKIKVSGPTEIVRGRNRVIALIGPTGVGKTTSLVKLASQYSLMHRAKVAMITADTYRIGAVEQLKIYRDIIDIPLEAVNTTAELEASLRRFSDRDLIFFDTAGRSPQNKRQIQELKSFLEVADPVETHLVMSATTKNADLLPIVGKFGLVPINRFLFTKLDETRSYGGFLNMASNFSIPISYLATGQNVPNDIESATAEGVAELVLGEGNGRPGR